jgi:flagellar hook-associated protein 1 FlgK
MRASTANSTDTTTANNLAQLSAFDPLMFELIDQVVLTFQASDTGDAPDTVISDATKGNAYPADQPIEFNGWRLTLRGGPSTGDSFTIEGVLSSPLLLDPVRQKRRNTGPIFALREKAMLGGVPPADGCLTLFSPLGAQVATSLEQACSVVAGANLDEETARLLQHQQSYQTAAHFLQIAQSSLDTLLQAVWADNEDKP